MAQVDLREVVSVLDVVSDGRPVPELVDDNGLSLAGEISQDSKRQIVDLRLGNCQIQQLAQLLALEEAMTLRGAPYMHLLFRIAAAAKTEGKNDEVLRARGLLFKMANEIEDKKAKIMALRKLLKLSPESLDILLSLIELTKSDRTQAKQVAGYCRDVLKIQPNNRLALNTLVEFFVDGVGGLGTSDYDLFVSYLEWLDQQGMNDGIVLLALAIGSSELDGDNEKALEYLTRYLANNPNDDQALRMYFCLSLGLGQFKAALFRYFSALKLKSQEEVSDNPQAQEKWVNGFAGILDSIAQLVVLKPEFKLGAEGAIAKIAAPFEGLDGDVSKQDLVVNFQQLLNFYGVELQSGNALPIGKFFPQELLASGVG